MTKVFNRPIKLGGHLRTIDSKLVRVLEYDNEGNIMRASGTTVPTGAGYAKGCLFIKTDAASGTKALYENQGTSSSASFNIVGDPSDDNLILGASGYGRMSTKTAAGSAVTIDSSYSYGEAIELRYTSSRTDNSSFQGLFMEIRTSAANTSGIRGCEIKAAQEGAIAVGGLEGGNFVAVTRSTTTGNIGYMYGVTGEANHNSAAYTGTVTEFAAVRGKASLTSTATYTDSSVFLAQVSQAAGGATIGSILRATTDASVAATNVFDIAVTATNFLSVDSTGQGGVTVSAEGMVKDPLNDAEAGYITIAVGAASYQIPIYATV